MYNIKMIKLIDLLNNFVRTILIEIWTCLHFKHNIKIKITNRIGAYNNVSTEQILQNNTFKAIFCWEECRSCKII